MESQHTPRPRWRAAQRNPGARNNPGKTSTPAFEPGELGKSKLHGGMVVQIRRQVRPAQPGGLLGLGRKRAKFEVFGGGVTSVLGEDQLSRLNPSLPTDEAQSISLPAIATRDGSVSLDANQYVEVALEAPHFEAVGGETHVDSVADAEQDSDGEPRATSNPSGLGISDVRRRPQDAGAYRRRRSGRSNPNGNGSDDPEAEYEEHVYVLPPGDLSEWDEEERRGLNVGLVLLGGLVAWAWWKGRSGGQVGGIGGGSDRRGSSGLLDGRLASLLGAQPNGSPLARFFGAQPARVAVLPTPPPSGPEAGMRQRPGFAPDRKL